MPLTHIEAWDDLMRRAKAAGINVAFNHTGVAVLLMPVEKTPPTISPEPSVPAGGSVAPGAASS